jgi:hypothetical protein
VATVAFFDGITASWLVLDELDELDELEELELLELLDDELGGGGMHGGTIRVATLLLTGSTSWFCGWAPGGGVPPAPPGVIRIVLAGGGAIVALLELLELELLELELDGEPHGSMATVCVNVLLGITISFDPGGMLLDPDCTAVASEHDVTAIVSGLCCRGITTVRTPGLISAAATGSILELLLELPPPPLPPQPVIATTAMHVAKAATGPVAAVRMLFIAVLRGGRARL